MEIHYNFSTAFHFNCIFLHSTIVIRRFYVKNKWVLHPNVWNRNPGWKVSVEGLPYDTCKYFYILMTMGKDIFPLGTTSSCRKLAQLPDQMRQIQLESLLAKAVIFPLALIMFIAVPWMELLSCWGGWVYLQGSLCQRHNELIFRVLRYAITSVSQKLLVFSAQPTNTNKHSTTGSNGAFV